MYMASLNKLNLRFQSFWHFVGDSSNNSHVSFPPLPPPPKKSKILKISVMPFVDLFFTIGRVTRFHEFVQRSMNGDIARVASSPPAPELSRVRGMSYHWRWYNTHFHPEGMQGLFTGRKILYIV